MQMADMINRANLENAKRDTTDLGIIVNGDENTTVTTRLGRVVDSISKAIKWVKEQGVSDLIEYVTQARAARDDAVIAKNEALEAQSKSEEARDSSISAASSAEEFKQETESLKNETEELKEATQVIHDETVILKNETASSELAVEGMKEEIQEIVNNLSLVTGMEILNASQNNEGHLIIEAGVDTTLTNIFFDDNGHLKFEYAI